MKLITHYTRVLVMVFYKIFYRINPEHEIFKGYLVLYLSNLGFEDVPDFLHNERLLRQLEFLDDHGYKRNYNGAVFIAGCCYAEQMLGFKHHHQCLSFGQTLSDIFKHRHEFEDKDKAIVISEALNRNGLAETTEISRLLRTAINLILPYQKGRR